MWTPQQTQFAQQLIAQIPDFVPTQASDVLQRQFEPAELRPPTPQGQPWYATRIPVFGPTAAADPPPIQPGPSELRLPTPWPVDWRAHHLLSVQDAWSSSLSPNPPLPPGPPPPTISGTKVLALQVINGGGNLVAGSTELISILLTDISNVFVSDVPGEGDAVPVPFPASVNITLITPSKTLKVSGAAMTADFSVPGKFDYIYQSIPTDEHGLWLASFTAADGMGSVALFPKRPAWNIVHRTMPKQNSIPPTPPPPPPPPPPATPIFVSDDPSVLFFSGPAPSQPSAPVMFTDDLQTYTPQTALATILNALGVTNTQYGGDLFYDGRVIILTKYGFAFTGAPAFIAVWTQPTGWAVPVFQNDNSFLGGGNATGVNNTLGPFAIAGNATTYVVGGLAPNGNDAVVWVGTTDVTKAANWSMTTLLVNANDATQVVQWIPRLNLFVAIGNGIWTAPSSGSPWTLRNAVDTPNGFAFEFYDDGTALWVLDFNFGGTNHIFTSTDAITWTANAYPPTFPAPISEGTIQLYFDATLNLWIANQPPDPGSHGGFYWATSPTGVWSRVTTSTTDNYLNITRVGSTIFAAGFRVNGLGAGLNGPILASTTDGKTWTVTVPTFPAGVIPANYSVTGFRVVGSKSGTALGAGVIASGTPSLPVRTTLYSADLGITWTVVSAGNYWQRIDVKS